MVRIKQSHREGISHCSSGSMKNRSGDREGDGVGPSGHGTISRRAHPSDKVCPYITVDDLAAILVGKKEEPPHLFYAYCWQHVHHWSNLPTIVVVIVEKSQKFIANADRMMQVVGSSPKRPRNKGKSRSTEESSGSRLVRNKRGKRPINFEGELTFLILSSHPKTQTGTLFRLMSPPLELPILHWHLFILGQGYLTFSPIGISQCWERDLSQELKEYTLPSSSKARKPTLSKLLDSYQIMVKESGLFSRALHDRCHKNETKKAQWR
ncbi:hypothetical protein PVK06_001501 [Gossypium arboreum]|uniref:Uncharacterized protein n=1 Tax=Gossypium arboreum TaxID=29729 RepID=A0ABR0R1G2_GOSAR|nr:hypothetical protein PVK06_001501 [Gossypium arboreum]